MPDSITDTLTIIVGFKRERVTARFVKQGLTPRRYYCEVDIGPRFNDYAWLIAHQGLVCMHRSCQPAYENIWAVLDYHISSRSTAAPPTRLQRNRLFENFSRPYPLQDCAPFATPTSPFDTYIFAIVAFLVSSGYRTLVTGNSRFGCGAIIIEPVSRIALKYSIRSIRGLSNRSHTGAAI